MTCIKCGRRIFSKGLRACPDCGASLAGVDAGEPAYASELASGAPEPAPKPAPPRVEPAGEDDLLLPGLSPETLEQAGRALSDLAARARPAGQALAAAPTTPWGKRMLTVVAIGLGVAAGAWAVAMLKEPRPPEFARLPEVGPCEQVCPGGVRKDRRRNIAQETPVMPGPPVYKLYSSETKVIDGCSCRVDTYDLDWVASGINTGS